MPFGFFKAQQKIDCTTTNVSVKEEEEKEDVPSEQHSSINEDYTEFDEEYYKLKVFNVLTTTSKLYNTYKEILKEEIKNEMTRYNGGNVKNNHNIYINNGI
jgi:hypothetical protein